MAGLTPEQQAEIEKLEGLKATIEAMPDQKDGLDLRQYKVSAA